MASELARPHANLPGSDWAPCASVVVAG